MPLVSDAERDAIHSRAPAEKRAAYEIKVPKLVDLAILLNLPDFALEKADCITLTGYRFTLGDVVIECDSDAEAGELILHILKGELARRQNPAP